LFEGKVEVELIPRENLTLEQVRAIELDAHEHRLIMGGPGSGKTQILLHRAAFLRQEYRVPNERFFVFVFTRALKDYIRSAFGLLDLPDDRIDTLDSWCRAHYLANIGRDLPWNSERKVPHFGRIRTAVRQHLKTLREPPLDFVLVDEGQDLTAEAFDLFRLAARHVTACMDHKQQIYEVGSNEQSILDKLGLARRNLTLLATYRCTPYIVDIASRLVDDPQHRDEFVRQCRISGSGRETPLLYVATDFEDEKHRLAEILRVRIGKGERIAILVPLVRQMYGFAKGLRELGFDVETKDQLDFSSSKPKVLPFPSAKGLTFDTVMMPRLVQSSFPNQSDERIQKLVFVGITRAMSWVYISSTAPHGFDALEKVAEGADVGAITIQHGGQRVPDEPPPPSQGAPATAPAGPVEDDDDLLDIL
jgi:superfamily I DNA/RNA helicase